MVAINEILLRECAGEGCGGDNDICTDSRVHHRNAENRAPVTRNHRSAPILGRWLTRDPISYRGGMNLYGYVDSSPVGNVDAEGTWFAPFRPGGGKFNVFLGPPSPGSNGWATDVSVVFRPSRQAQCHCKKMMLVQFVRRFRGTATRGWHLDNGIMGWWGARARLWLLHGPKYYGGQAPTTITRPPGARRSPSFRRTHGISPRPAETRPKKSGRNTRFASAGMAGATRLGMPNTGFLPGI